MISDIVSDRGLFDGIVWKWTGLSGRNCLNGSSVLEAKDKCEETICRVDIVRFIRST